MIQFDVRIFFRWEVQPPTSKKSPFLSSYNQGLELIAWTSTGAIGKHGGRFFCVFFGKGYNVLPWLKAKIASQKWWLESTYPFGMADFQRLLRLVSGSFFFTSRVPRVVTNLGGRWKGNISIAKRYTQQFRKKTWPRIFQTFLERIGAEIRHRLRWVANVPVSTTGWWPASHFIRSYLGVSANCTMYSPKAVL